MSANVDVELFTSVYIGITPVIQILSKLKYDICIHKIITINDWEWNGEKSIDVTISSEEVHKLVLEGKIVWIYLQTKEAGPQWNGGCALHQIDGNLFATSLFLNTTHHEYFFGDIGITERNHNFFDTVTDCIIALALKSSFLFAGMGIEITIDFSRDVIEAINSSYGVSRWVAQQRLPLLLEHYVEQHIDSVYIYTLINGEEKTSYIPQIEKFQTHKYMCPVCGYPGLYDDPFKGSYEICPSCGFEPGYTDDDLDISYEQWRQQWLSEGMHWYSKHNSPPFGWDPKQQLKNLEE